MCNAMGHPPGCTCGFGKGAAAVPYSNSQRLFFDTIWQQKLASYVNPNAFCPVCGAQVFFYQSPNGGRVFFDELGPPWPKHPCTDNSNYKISDKIDFIPPEYHMNEDTLTNWQQRGWSPFLVRSVSSYGVLLKIKGFLKKRDFELYAQGAPHSEIINQFDLLPFWIKTEGLSGYYSIATFLEKEIVFKASRDARDFDYPKSKIKRHNI